MWVREAGVGVGAAIYGDRMMFTALHRALGLQPGPLTERMLDAAITAGVAETDDLDWKAKLPPKKGLPQTDFPKDVAAMANSGGGVIVYGVKEAQGSATERCDVGELDEGHERDLRRAAVVAITPPVFGLGVHRLGTDQRAVVVLVPASVDGPHLIYKEEHFGAPVRNGADTVWMKERQIEAAYRARFDDRRRSSEALDALYTQAATGRDSDARAWLVAAAHPRIPGAQTSPDREQARTIMDRAEAIALSYSQKNAVHPLEFVDRANPRPGFRRWVAPFTRSGESSRWREAWAEVHRDRSVTLAAAVGGHRNRSGDYNEAWEVESAAIEAAIADFTALLRATAEVLGHDEYDVSVGIEWSGGEKLSILTVDGHGFTFNGVSTPLPAFIPVQSTIDASASEIDFHRQVFELAEDCVNQGGITYLHVISPPRILEEPDTIGTP